jgi:hypothetical protein
LPLPRHERRQAQMELLPYRKVENIRYLIDALNTLNLCEARAALRIF